MNNSELQNSLSQGKTYSLFADSGTSDGYYLTIKLLADKITELNPDIASVMQILTQKSSKKKYLKTLLKKTVPGNPVSDIINLVNNDLKPFTMKTEEHLKTLSPLKFWDRRLGTTREQYHLYMLEIELTNRLYVSDFKKSTRKIALLPYCLQDFSVDCKADKTGFDYQCKHCSGKCFQNQSSRILEKNNIEPYIWMGGDLKNLVKKTYQKGQSFGVLGIACIPELLWGMRKCRKYGIPVVGIPLNANRCIRWFGEFHPNSVNLGELESLVG
jgi:hypothetical protein